MDRFELVKKLVNSTGVSYADAKAALEASGWDLLDAAVWLEQNGKTEGKSSHYTTNPEQKEEQRKQQEDKQDYETTRNSSRTESKSGRFFDNILSKSRGIIMDNQFVICKRNGGVFLEIPVWLFIILLVVAFWPTVIVLLLAFVIGFRFRMHGPDLGTDRVNKILNKSQKAAGDFVDRVKNANSTPTSKDDVVDYKDPYRKE